MAGAPPNMSPAQQQAWLRESNVRAVAAEASAKFKQISETDKRAWEIVTGVPKMKDWQHYACAAGNVCISGSGTIACAFLSDRNLSKTQLLMGLTQFFTSAYIVGYLLSLYWAWLFIQKANSKDDGSSQPIAAGQPTNSEQLGARM